MVLGQIMGCCHQNGNLFWHDSMKIVNNQYRPFVKTRRAPLWGLRRPVTSVLGYTEAV